MSSPSLPLFVPDAIIPLPVTTFPHAVKRQFRGPLVLLILPSPFINGTRGTKLASSISFKSCEEIPISSSLIIVNYCKTITGSFFLIDKLHSVWLAPPFFGDWATLVEQGMMEGVNMATHYLALYQIDKDKYELYTFEKENNN